MIPIASRPAITAALVLFLLGVGVGVAAAATAGGGAGASGAGSSSGASAGGAGAAGGGAAGGNGNGAAGGGAAGGNGNGAGAAGGGAAGGGGNAGGGEGGGSTWRNHNNLHVNFCGGGLRLPNPDKFVYAENGVRAVSRKTERYFNQCECETKNCIADALDRYAAELAVLAPRLGPDLRNLPSIVSSAARRVRAARTNTEAVAALRQAVAAVHKEISLIRVSDPDVQAPETRGGVFVAQALDAAASKLERAREI